MTAKRCPPARECEVCGSSYRPGQLGERQRTCSPECRKALRVTKQCPVCGDRYPASQATQRVCLKPECRRVLFRSYSYRATPVEYVSCAMCGQLFVYSKFRRHGGGKLCCTQHCRDARIKRQVKANQARRYRSDPGYRDRIISANQNRRARKLGFGSEAILLTYLIERDRGRCGICRKPVRATSGPMGPSIDHIVPLSLGGGHLLANVHLAHLKCNIAKGNRNAGQALLFG